MRYRVSVFILFIAQVAGGQSLVLPGDFPDPSVVKSGSSYWATATTSNWAPAFPLMESKDLIHWELKAHVFTTLPAWADYYFWAPEITFDNGRYYIYYSAHQRGGNLCVAVASADSPGGPYTDHGPLICQEAGSIDGWPMRDRDGKLYLIWKEDGNSVKLPTSIWASEMDESRTKLIGDKTELFRNDATWEGNVVEGVSMLRHGEYFYAFYAGAGCCGRACSYDIGVARAKDLLGPWEKYPANPVVATGEHWKCPGHGTPVEHAGKFYFLYHAYERESNVYAGRQGVLSEFRFTKDGWIEFVNSPRKDEPIQREIRMEFNGAEIPKDWQWSVFQNPSFAQKNGRLVLDASRGRSGSFIGIKTLSGNYHVDVTVLPESSSEEAGLALVGDEKNFVMAGVQMNRIVVRKVEGDKETVVEQVAIPGGKKVFLRAKVDGGKDVSFFYSTDGKNFVALNREIIDGFFLPPWDRAVRAALVARGQNMQKAVFDDFVMKNN